VPYSLVDMAYSELSDDVKIIRATKAGSSRGAQSVSSACQRDEPGGGPSGVPDVPQRLGGQSVSMTLFAARTSTGRVATPVSSTSECCDGLGLIRLPDSVCRSMTTRGSV
jgi:hypothetical protein